MYFCFPYKGYLTEGPREGVHEDFLPPAAVVRCCCGVGRPIARQAIRDILVYYLLWWSIVYYLYNNTVIITTSIYIIIIYNWLIKIEPVFNIILHLDRLICKYDIGENPVFIYTSNTAFIQPSFSGLFVTCAYFPHITLPVCVTNPNSLTLTCKFTVSTVCDHEMMIAWWQLLVECECEGRRHLRANY